MQPKEEKEIEQGNIRDKKLGNQIGEHIIDLSELNILETFKVIFPKWIARILFPVESTIDIKIKITYHRVIGDQCIWKGITIKNSWWASQS